MPKVTVLMPMYNVESYVGAAIDSILQQTFTDFEFLIINDGSTDQSAAIVNSYDDRRIVLINNEKNIGLIATLNKGLSLAHGEYIARMDADDISYPTRLEKQVNFLDKNKKIGICGTWLKMIGDASGIGRYAYNHDGIKAQLFFYSSMAHATIMIRENVVKKFSIYYNENYPYAEDYHLWTQCIDLFSFANLQEVLYKYRINKQSSTQHNVEQQFDTVKKIRKEYWEKNNIFLSKEDFAHWNVISNRRFHIFSLKKNMCILDNMYKVLKFKIPNTIFTYYLSELINFFAINIAQVKKYDIFLLAQCIKSKMFYRMPLIYKVKFILKCVICYEKRG